MMTERNVLFILLLSIISQVVGMENDKGSLTFLANQEMKITAALAYKMKFLIPQEEFTGKNILDVIPLSKQEKDGLSEGINNAYMNNIIVKVPYCLENKKFIATITPLYLDADSVYANFSFKVKEDTTGKG